MGLTGRFTARNRTWLQPMMPNSTFLTYHALGNLEKALVLTGVGNCLTAQEWLQCLHQMIKASSDCSTRLSLKRYVRILSQKIQELPFLPLLPHWSCAIAPRFTSAETGMRLLLQVLRKLTSASHHNQRKGVCHAPLSFID